MSMAWEINEALDEGMTAKALTEVSRSAVRRSTDLIRSRPRTTRFHKRPTDRVCCDCCRIFNLQVPLCVLRGLMVREGYKIPPRANVYRNHTWQFVDDYVYDVRMVNCAGSISNA